VYSTKQPVLLNKTVFQRARSENSYTKYQKW